MKCEAVWTQCERGSNWSKLINYCSFLYHVFPSSSVCMCSLRLREDFTRAVILASKVRLHRLLSQRTDAAHWLIIRCGFILFRPDRFLCESNDVPSFPFLNSILISPQATTTPYPPQAKHTRKEILRIAEHVFHFVHCKMCHCGH